MQSLQYKNLCKAVSKESEAQTRADKDRPKLWVKIEQYVVDKEAWSIYVRNEITQGTDKWKIVILSYRAVVL